ncbi:uncharacterized protein [Nothobranchius furzeri]|uniref:uncharacterized protein n=1 Tax=Nothobranchius furzeri TaxID=105023 RepID=UPI0024045CE5|nr:uncharacterized protein sb:cb288 [Nothobranchius furzeri]
MENRSFVVVNESSNSQVVLGEQLVHQQSNVSTAAATCASCTEDPLTRTSGIIPGAIAATVFIVFLLGLYAVLWKCMMSPPQRKKRKVRTRVKQKAPV